MYSPSEYEDLKLLRSIRNGNKIIASKEYMLVFYITCFVPFIRPNLPLLKDGELMKLKNLEKEKLKKLRMTNNYPSNNNEGFIDKK